MSAVWDWVVEAHGRPGVEEACVALQDEHGQCVSFLLWALWAAPDAQALARGAQAVRTWNNEVLQPLRAARRSSKTSFAGIDDKARLALRELIKRDELEAERILLESLAVIAEPGAGARPPPQAILVAAAAAWSPASFPISDLERLARAFSGA